MDALAPRLAELSRTEQWLNSLLCLLESYLSAFPSSTNTAESPDISLFDHLKTTAAIGVCISEYLADQNETQFKKRLFDKEKQFMDEQAFLLYSADFSGIQKFIYTVASEKALRSLRSRSFFLELAMEHYADELLSLCGVGRTNLLYTGGGHCYMLLPNTTEVRAAIERWNRRFNDWLSEQFGISLFLAHGYTRAAATSWSTSLQSAAPTRRCSGAYPLRWLGTSCTAMTQRRFKNSTAATQTADVNAKSADVQTAFRRTVQLVPAVRFAV